MGLIDNRNESLEEKLGSKLLVYFTADSPIVGGMVAEDAIIPMFDHSEQSVNRITLYLYSPGGQMETPWKLQRSAVDQLLRIS